MPKRQPEWEQLEIIVAEIQKQLASGAVVHQNDRVVGKSGRTRRLDVTIRQKVAAIPVFIVFDCKHRSKPVKLKEVEAFAGQLEDVSADLGVMVSSSGFDAGAKAKARVTQKNIILQTFRKADETDWNQLIGENAWVALTKVEMLQVNTFATFAGNQELVEIPFATQLCDERGETLGSVEKRFREAWEEIGQPIGDVNIQLLFEGFPWFVEREGVFLEIKYAVIGAKLIAKKFIVNLYLAEGNIIEDEGTSEPIYRSLVSRSFDWGEIMNNQPGIEISPEEYEQILHESKGLVDLSNAKPYLRLVFEDKREQSKTML